MENQFDSWHKVVNVREVASPALLCALFAVVGLVVLIARFKVNGNFIRFLKETWR